MIFSQALLLFAPILFLAFLVLFTLKEKKTWPIVQKFWICNVAFILSSLYFLFEAFNHTVRTQTFFAFISLHALIILLSLVLSPDDKKSRATILCSTICLHLISTISLWAVTGIEITERSWDLQRIVSSGYWLSEGSKLNAFYDIYPLDLGFLAILSKVMNLQCFSPLLYVSWVSGSILVFDLLVYSLIQRLHISWRSGIMAILLVTSSPLLVWTGGHTHYSMVFLITVIFLVFSKVKTLSRLSIGIIVGLAGIILHVTLPSAVIWVLITLSLIILFFKILHKNIPSYSLDLLVILVTLSFIRWLFTESHFDTMIHAVNGFIQNVLLMRGTGIALPGVETRYDQFASPIFAYAWALPIALVAAYILKEIVVIVRLRNKNYNYVTFLFGIVGLSMAFVTFTMQVIGGSDSFTPRMIVAAYALIILVVGKECVRILRSRKIVTVIIIIILIPYFVVGFQDPRKATETADVLSARPIKLYEFLQVRSLQQFLLETSGNKLLVTTPYIHRGLAAISDVFHRRNIMSTEDSLTRGLVNAAKLGQEEFEYKFPTYVTQFKLNLIVFIRPVSDVSVSVISEYSIGYSSGVMSVYWKAIT